MALIKKLKFFSLRGKFVLLSLFNLVIPLVLIIGLSYTKSIELVENHVARSNFNTVEQIADNLEFLFSDATNMSNQMLQNREYMTLLRLPKERVEENPRYLLSLQHFIHNTLSFHRNIHSVYVEAFNGLQYDSSGAKNWIGGDLRLQLRLLRGEGVFIPDEITNFNGTKTKVVSFVKIIKDTEDLAEDLAFLKINMTEESISDLLDSRLLNDTSRSLIIDENGGILSSTNTGEIGRQIPGALADGALSQGGSGYYNEEIDGESFVVTYYDLAIPRWKLLNLTLLSEFSQDVHVIRQVTMTTITLSVLLCTIAIAYFMLAVLGPIKELRKAMKSLENEDFDVNIPVHGNDEIAMLSDSFNKMSKKMGALVNEILAMQIKQQEAEIKSLQAQFNPHFLYNTLDMIYWTCRLEEAEESAMLVHTLSKLFRVTLSAGHEMIPLSKEVEHLELYLRIQKKRYDGNMSFSINVMDGLDDLNVVKLILQPLVENAIIHGIEKNGGSGAVDITIYRENGTLVYEIKDDGAGAEETEVYGYLNNIGDDNRGFALNNVNARIKIRYGEAYGISFKTSPGNGMTVKVTQPVIRKEDE